MNTPYRQKLASFSWLFFLIFWLPACSTLQNGHPEPKEKTTYYPDVPTDGLAAANCPVFLVERTERPYNRIGTPSVRDKKGKPYVWVDPASPTIYYQQRKFTTSKGTYTNIIYRVHFERIPFGTFPPHLTTGKNPGLLVIVTLDDSNRPLLVSTLHTCGCYLSITPTSYLASELYPNNWDTKSNNVFGEKLPGLLDYSQTDTPQPCFLLKIRSETHRVMDIELIAPAGIKSLENKTKVNLRPMQDLHSLIFKDDLISFYETKGLRKGHVKNSRKPLEMLFMGWWAMDPFIGEDKDLGPADTTGTIFYTSLKFWRRQDSNLWDFARFIKYWGWKL